MRFIKVLGLGLMLLAHLSGFAQQDTVKIMSYNTLNYDQVSGSCPDNVNYKKNKYLREILKYENPDILGLVKMNLAPDFVNDSIPKYVLDSVCPGCWSHSVLTYHSGYSKCNMLYFKKDKFVLYSTKTIYSADGSISDINLHQLYYKDTALARTHDTVFLNIILVHDLSGGSSSAQRATEIQGAMSWLDAHVHKLTNYIFMGDFNVTSSSEGCFQAMINPTNKDLKFNEPTGALGSWSSNPQQYSKYLTQSTRTTALPDCGSSGGINDWLDHIMCSDFIMNGTDAFTYVPQSFTVTGQDGQHVKKSLIDAPKDTIVPANILNDLYHFSNHLPVKLKLAVNPQHHYVGIRQAEAYSPSLSFKIYNGKLHLQNDDLQPVTTGSLLIFNSVGTQIYTCNVKDCGVNNPADISALAPGIYIAAVQANGRMMASQKFVKM